MRHPEPSIPESASAQHIVRAYHQRTKHRFECYAAGPDTLDWDAQPAAFRHFTGAPSIALPAFADCLHDATLHGALTRPFATLANPIPPASCTLLSLSALLHLALGITAWKTYGPDRWAVRANPSSGNLHPVEAYVLVQGMSDLTDGIYHYRVESHTLEFRADIRSEHVTSVSNSQPSLQIAISAVMWREAWKYGERAFRYCQLDVGHAVAALAYAAEVLGWAVSEQRQISTDALSHLLGLDRASDFPSKRSPETEREEAEILLSLSFEQTQAKKKAHPKIQPSAWHGIASTIDAHPMYRWPLIDDVALATRHQAQHDVPVISLLPAQTSSIDNTHRLSSADVILGRRSAQRFDARHVMPKQDFFNLLQATIPSVQAPWNTLSSRPGINLLIFVHRVEGLTAGLYLLVREPRLADQLDKSLNAQFLRQAVENAPSLLNLQFLTPAPTAELHRVARSLHCHQDIAANACFAVGMLAEYEAVLAHDTSAYRDLHREAGLIGQVLYLQAEAAGLRGTGIGCFFDDPVHELLGLQDETFQSIYHFTVGLALADTRIDTQATFSTLAKSVRTS